MSELSTEQLEALGIYKSYESDYKFFCQSPYHAQLLNRLLAYPYPKEVNFIQESSEGIFKFSKAQLPAVLAVIKN